MDNFVLRTQLSILTSSTFTAYEAGSVLGAALLRRPPCPRVRRPHGALRATHRAPRRAWSAGTAEQSVRSTVVEAADQAATSSRGKRLRLQPQPSPRCAARASPVRRHHRAPTVRAANRRSEPGHARTPCAFRHSSSCLGCGCTPFGRAPSTRALLGPACKETWDHLRHVRPRAVRRPWCDEGNGGGDRCHEGAA